MIVSWNWLTQYVRLTLPVEALAERLALTGLNHESTTELGGDLVSRGMIRDLSVEGSRVTFTIVLTTPACPLKAVMQKQSEEAIRKIAPGVTDIKINWDADVSIAHRGGAVPAKDHAAPCQAALRSGAG